MTFRNLLALYRELAQLLIADLLDDVDCSPSTLHHRNRRVGEIVDALPPAQAERAIVSAGRFAARVAARAGHYASGAPYPRIRAPRACTGRAVASTGIRRAAPWRTSTSAERPKLPVAILRERR